MNLFGKVETKRMVRSAAPTPQLSEEQLMKSIFREHDRDGDGRLAKAELKDAFKTMGATMPGWRAMRGLQFGDVNGDGYVSEEEMNCLLKYALKFGYPKE